MKPLESSKTMEISKKALAQAIKEPVILTELQRKDINFLRKR